jgi:hypothetical protein
VPASEVKLTPDYETNYTYIIGSQMAPIQYRVSSVNGTSKITVNGDQYNIEQTYGVILTQ